MRMTSGQRYTKMRVANIAYDSTLGLDLEKIRGKILALYNALLTQAYKAENPTASPEELQAFLEENALDFPETEDSEVDELLDMIDEMTKEDDLDPVDKDGKSPDVEQGKEPKSKSHEQGDTPDTKPVPIQTGMLNTPADQRVKKRTRSLDTPTGKIKERKPELRRASFGELFDGIKDELADLKQRQRIGRKMMEDRL